MKRRAKRLAVGISRERRTRVWLYVCLPSTSPPQVNTSCMLTSENILAFFLRANYTYHYQAQPPAPNDVIPHDGRGNATPLFTAGARLQCICNSNKDELSAEALRGVSLVIFGSPRERFLQDEVTRSKDASLPPLLWLEIASRFNTMQPPV